ncbi:MAG: DMT family transporter [Candidatus Izimaplasma sp.]|nr:DMT family transporter [Candidatus Izimaplasma bacterium]
MNLIGEFISLGTALCWTLTVISFEKAGKDVGSISVNYLRIIFGFLFLGLFLWITRGSFIPIDASYHSWTWLLASGIIGLVIGDLFLFQAFLDVGGRISLVIMSMVPVLTSIMSFIFLDEVLSLIDILGMILTLGGILFVLYYKRQNKQPSHPHIVRGILFALIGAFAQAIGLIFSKVGMGDFNAFAATQIRIIAALIGFTLFMFFKSNWKNVRFAVTKKRAMIYILIGSFFGPFLGVSTSLLAIQYTQIGIATTIAQTNVLMIIPFSVLMFNEKINMQEIIGTIIAFSGVALLFLF